MYEYVSTEYDTIIKSIKTYITTMEVVPNCCLQNILISLQITKIDYRTKMNFKKLNTKSGKINRALHKQEVNPMNCSLNEKTFTDKSLRVYYKETQSICCQNPLTSLYKKSSVVSFIFIKCCLQALNARTIFLKIVLLVKLFGEPGTTMNALFHFF